ncbi:MAG: N-acetylornithine carbamoyltransferase [Promethearchaeota archaeon]
MKKKMRADAKKDFITTQDWDLGDLRDVLELAGELRSDPRKFAHELDGESLGMIFFNPSTRTRNSFEVGMAQLGGHAVYNDSSSSWLGRQSESVKDTASVMSAYHSILGIRIFPNVVRWKFGAGNRILRDFARHSRVPVVNFEDDLYHPCQALSDVFTMRDRLGSLEGKRVTVAWAYHPRPLPVSVPNSTVLNTTRFGLDVTLLHPPGFELDGDTIEAARRNAGESGGSFRVVHDLEEGYRDADVVYVKSWGSLKAYGDMRAEKKLRVPFREQWTCTAELMSLAGESSLFMHCLPVRRNVVVTDEVIDGPHSIVYEQAGNRLHVQKALLLYLLRNT